MATATREQAPREAFRGIYAAPDAANYVRATMPDYEKQPVALQMTSTKLLRWIRTGVATSSFPGIPGRELLIDFDDLVSMRVIATLRAAGVSWPAIRKSEMWLRQQTGAPKPFATSTLWHGTGDVYTKWSQKLIAASRAGQAAFDFLHDSIISVSGLELDDDADRALWWTPRKEIRLNPKIQFGAPCIVGTRIPTASVAGAIRAGDSEELVRNAYDITAEQLEAALVWESRLRSAA